MADRETPEGVLDRAGRWLRRRWHGLLVVALGVFMFVTRMRPYDAYNQPDQSYFIGTDAYYHARHVLYTVHNFPQTLGYDPWTQYPLGTDAGPFGTLFDQGAALLAWTWGLVTQAGMPSEETILDVLTAYPALLGALTIVPVYLLTRDMFGKGPGLFAAIALALLPGAFLRRSIAGWPDHHSIEALLSTLTLYGAYRALSTWQDTEVTLADLVEAPLEALRRHRGAVVGSALAALAFFVYLAAWPPGVLFVGIAGIWLIVQTLVEVGRDRAPGPVAATSTTMFAFLAVLMLPYALGSDTGGFSALDYTWMQVTAPLLISLGTVVLVGLAWVWQERALPRRGYPPAMLVVGGVALGLLYVLVPGLVQQVASGAGWVLDSTLGWLPGIGVQRTRLTIAEAQPIQPGVLPAQFGWLLYSAIGGFLLALVDAVREGDDADTLLVVWTFVAASGAFTQSRFLYYLAIAVVALNAKLARRLFDGAKAMAEPPDDAGKGRSSQDRIDPRTGKAIVVVFLAVMLLPVNVLGFTADCRTGEPNAWVMAGCFSPDPETRDWTEATTWMRENTPQGPISLTTPYDAPPAGERFDYEEGAYGILSWWDYGHIIEFKGQRPPVANPFQQQAPLASEIFTAPNESAARSILTDYLGPGNEVRYLMIDDAMVSRKFGAITVWAGVQETYRQGGSRVFSGIPGTDRDSVQLPTIGDKIAGMFLIDVYRSDADGFEHFRLVHENPHYAWIGNQGRIQQGSVRLSGYNTILGTGSPERTREAFGSLSHTSGSNVLPAGQNRFVYDIHVESVVKTYEHVPGARLAGTGDPGDPVRVEIPMEVTSTGRTFTYTQGSEVGDQGRFTLTVPYATTDHVPVDAGGTDLAVVAQGPATVTVGNRSTTVDIPDRAVLEGGTVQVPAS